MMNSLVFMRTVINLIRRHLRSTTFVVNKSHPAMNMTREGLVTIAIYDINFPTRAIRCTLRLLPIHVMGSHRGFITTMSTRRVLFQSRPTWGPNGTRSRLIAHQVAPHVISNFRVIRIGCSTNHELPRGFPIIRGLLTKTFIKRTNVSISMYLLLRRLIFPNRFRYRNNLRRSRSRRTRRVRYQRSLGDTSLRNSLF